MKKRGGDNPPVGERETERWAGSAREAVSSPMSAVPVRRMWRSDASTAVCLCSIPLSTASAPSLCLPHAASQANNDPQNYFLLLLLHHHHHLLLLLLPTFLFATPLFSEVSLIEGPSVGQQQHPPIPRPHITAEPPLHLHRHARAPPRPRPTT